MEDPRAKLLIAIKERNTLANQFSQGNKDVYPGLCIAEDKVCELRQQYYKWRLENRFGR